MKNDMWFAVVTNGQIGSGRELLGNNTLLINGQTAANGFEAPKELDDNRDGVTDDGELLTLSQAGVMGSLSNALAASNDEHWKVAV